MLQHEEPSTELEHHGILGQRWGVRRFQNEDGTLTPAGRKRLASDNYELAKMRAGTKLKRDVSKASESDDKKLAVYKAQLSYEKKMAKAKNEYKMAIKSIKDSSRKNEDDDIMESIKGNSKKRGAIKTYIGVAIVALGTVAMASSMKNSSDPQQKSESTKNDLIKKAESGKDKTKSMVSSMSDKTKQTKSEKEVAKTSKSDKKDYSTKESLSEISSRMKAETSKLNQTLARLRDDQARLTLYSRTSNTGDNTYKNRLKSLNSVIENTIKRRDDMQGKMDYLNKQISLIDDKHK